MLEGVALTPSDRVLFLTIPDHTLILEVAGTLASGLAAAIGDRDLLAAARRSAAHLDNVMFTPGSPEEIPWQDCFFSWAIDVRGGWELDRAAAAEIYRILAPGGHAWLSGLDVAPLLESGLVETVSTPGYLLLRKSDSPAGPPQPNSHFPML